MILLCLCPAIFHNLHPAEHFDERFNTQKAPIATGYQVGLARHCCTVATTTLHAQYLPSCLRAGIGSSGPMQTAQGYTLSTHNQVFCLYFESSKRDAPNPCVNGQV